jgi:hypothetical protein
VQCSCDFYTVQEKIVIATKMMDCQTESSSRVPEATIRIEVLKALLYVLLFQ